MDIGHKIKELRIARGLTQEELADRSELSKGFISQLENDYTSPSISTLEDILICLGISVADFFAEENEEQVVFTEENDYFIKDDAEHMNEIKWIVPTAQKNQMEPIIMNLEAGGSTNEEMPGEGEEFGYVLKGQITIHLGSKAYIAKKGDSFYYRQAKKHYITSKKGASFIWVSTPPSF